MGDDTTHPGNRTIFFMWLQGLGSAPRLVRRCHETWVAKNPGWNVVVLTSENLGDYVDLPDWAASKLNHAQFSDLARLRLLQRHGGIWADATTFCTRPLDDWLPDNYAGRVFAFSAPSRGFLLSSWFLAAEPDHPVIVAAGNRLEAYWHAADLQPPGRLRLFIGKVLFRVFGRSTRASELWFSRPVRDWLRVYPFFAIHYSIAAAVRADPEAAEAWRRMPVISSIGPHVLQSYGLARHPDARMVAELRSPTSPMYKLTWKAPEALEDPESVLSELLS